MLRRVSASLTAIIQCSTGRSSLRKSIIVSWTRGYPISWAWWTTKNIVWLPRRLVWSVTSVAPMLVVGTSNMMRLTCSPKCSIKIINRTDLGTCTWPVKEAMRILFRFLYKISKLQRKSNRKTIWNIIQKHFNPLNHRIGSSASRVCITSPLIQPTMITSGSSKPLQM